MTNSEGHQKANKVTRRGLLLKETRESKGLSIETVHELTKIPLDVLHAIEEGYTVRMVSAYYFKGFLKMYAKFLGLDATLVLDEPLPAASSSEEPVSVAMDPQHKKFNEYISRQSKKQNTINLIVTGIIVVFLMGVWGFWIKRPRTGTAVAIPMSHVKKEQPKKKFLETQAADRKMIDKTKPKTKTETKPVAKAVVSEESIPGESMEEPPAQTVKRAAAVGRKVTLTIRSRAAGWLQVKVDGNLVFQSTLRAGAAESWEADKSIELSGKNINNLDFEVNGKVLGQLGKSDRGARRVLVTNEGLTVKK